MPQKRPLHDISTSTHNLRKESQFQPTSGCPSQVTSPLHQRPLKEINPVLNRIMDILHSVFSLFNLIRSNAAIHLRHRRRTERIMIEQQELQARNHRDGKATLFERWCFFFQVLDRCWDADVDWWDVRVRSLSGGLGVFRGGKQTSRYHGVDYFPCLCHGKRWSDECMAVTGAVHGVDLCDAEENRRSFDQRQG
jgi:hypothetical protein